MPNFSSLKKIITHPLKQACGVYQIEDSILSRQQIEFWENHGYLILKNFFAKSVMDSVNEWIDRLWATRRESNHPLVIDIHIGTPAEKRIYFRDAPDECRLHPYKLSDLFLSSQDIREVVLESKLAKSLNQLLGGAPLVCNTLNFEFGSQQGAHVDTLYMPPSVPNKMLATWIALEDCQKEAGPLFYYPGSHKIDPYYFSHGKLNYIREEMPQFNEYVQKNIEARGLVKEYFYPNQGDVLIWHAQLLHGGSEILSPGMTRKSLVTHYFRAMDFPLKNIKLHKYGRFYVNRDHNRVTQ